MKNKTTLQNDTTELVFILDRSGSMSGLESDTVGGFNGLIEKQRKQPGTCFVTTVLFDNTNQILHDRIALDQISPMTDKEYTVGGCTALLDAIGTTVAHVEKVHQYIRPEDVPAHTVFVITTDGLENASKEYNAGAIKKLIERKKEKDGWEFLFLGANIDAVETAQNYGINADRAATYRADAEGTAVLYEAVSEAVCCARASRPIAANWSKKISENLNRKKGGSAQ